MWGFLLVATLSLPFMDLEVFQLAGKSIVLPYCATFLLIIPLVARLREATAHAREDGVLPWLVAWFLATCCSSVWIFLCYKRPEVLDRNLTQLANLLLMIVQYLFFVCAFRAVAADRLYAVVRVVLWSALLGSVYSVYQFTAVYLGVPAPDVFRTSNLYLKLNTLDPGGAGGWAGVPRAFGFAPEPSFWGGYLVVCAALVLGRLGTRVHARDLAVLLVLATAILVTFSRGAWLSLAVVMLLSVVSRVTVRMPSAVAGVALMTIGVTLWPLAAGEEVLTSLTDLSAMGRLASQQTGWRVFFDHPIFGIGFGSAGFFVQRYNTFFASINTFSLEHLYNLYLLVLVSTGIVGFGLFLSVLLALVRCLTLAYSHHVEFEVVKALRLGAALGYAGCLVFWLNTPGYNFTFVWFVMALVSVLPAAVEQEALAGHGGSASPGACASPSI